MSKHKTHFVHINLFKVVNTTHNNIYFIKTLICYNWLLLNLLHGNIDPHNPTGFNITNVYYAILNYTISLKWNQPEGSGSAAVVDRYILSVIPKPVSHPISNEVNSTIWNVTLNYNTVYTATITAVNCAGESNTVVLPGIQYSMH